MQTAEYTLTPRPAIEALRTLIRARKTVCLWGEPGVSKSSIVAQVAAQESLSLIDLRMSTLDPTDLRGLPAVSADRTQTAWIPPDFLPRDGRGVILFDELNRAQIPQQNSALQLVLYPHTLGAYTLPIGWSIVAACNYEGNGGGINRMTAALCNRFHSHLHIEVSLEDWCTWAVANGIEPVVIAFLRFRPEYLHQFDPNARSFPTPRSWEFISDIVKQQPHASVELALLCGSVGRAAGIEFAAFLKLYRTLPSIDAILLNPGAAIVPQDVATQYAVAAALARKATDANFTRVIQYLDRLPIEFNVFSVRDSVTRDNALASTPAFVNWSVKHQDVTIQ